MAEPPSKQPKIIDGKLLKQTVQNLPLLCVETICKFTPTSGLVRLYSNAVPLPGAFWNVCLEAALLRKRFPLSIKPYPPIVPVVIFDEAGAEVARIKQPDAFRFSPLRDLIGRAFLLLHAVIPATEASEKMQLYVEHGEAILSHLPNVTELALVVEDVQHATSYFIRREVTLEKNKIEANLKHSLPGLHSLTVSVRGIGMYKEGARVLYVALADYLCEVALPEMASLRRLGLPEGVFGNVTQQVVSCPGSAGERLFSQVSALSFSRGSWWFRDLFTGPDLMRMVASHYRQLSTLLNVPVRGEFKDYLAAFRALLSLSSLGLHLINPDLKGITKHKVLAIASLFPNAKAIALHRAEEHLDAMELAAELCTKRVLPAVEKLSCFNLDEISWCSAQRLTEFIANPNLPEAVDLSPMVLSELADEDPNLLTEIYRAMQSNATKSLLLRGPIHANSLSNLQDYVDLNVENAKVIAWKDRDLGAQPGIWNLKNFCLQTDVKIVGVKNAGSLKGEPFTIRVVHQLAMRSGIFEFD